MSDTFEFPLSEQNPGANSPVNHPAVGGAAHADKRPSAQLNALDATSRAERRCRRRALISAPVRVRTIDVTDGGPDEISTTLDVSRGGVLFATRCAAFEVAMTVAVTFPYSKSPVAVQAEQMGRVARVTKMPDGRFSVAVMFKSGAGEIIDSCGHKLEDKSLRPGVTPDYSPELGSKRPLVLVVDKTIAIRDSLKSYLTAEGYDVIAVGSAPEAHHVMDMFTPALLIAEIEGEDLPGYELCAHVKSSPRLKTVPVMLLTSSAYPSDYSNAHSLGAVVCMAKPFRQERLGHMVRLLAPNARNGCGGGNARRTGEAPKPAGYTPNVRFRPTK
jgi:CheY-like chemotaxis protein